MQQSRANYVFVIDRRQTRHYARWLVRVHAFGSWWTVVNPLSRSFWSDVNSDVWRGSRPRFFRYWAHHLIERLDDAPVDWPI